METLGPLQMKVIMLLRDEALCGVEIMEKLNIRSPGTIYPVLKILKKKQLIDYEITISKSIRKKVYSLTRSGREQITNHLNRYIRNFCCVPSLYLNKILENSKDLIKINEHQKIFCTLEYDELKKFFKGADVSFSSDLIIQSNAYDLVMGFLGVGCLLGKGTVDVFKFLTRLHQNLKKNGLLLAIEIEKTDNFFANLFFRDLMGLYEPLGLCSEELKEILEQIGFSEIKIVSRSGLLYAVARKVSS